MELEILRYSYSEHFKKAKDLALILPVGHPERILLQNTIDEITLKIKLLTV